MTSYQVVAATVHCSKLVVRRTPRQTRVLEGAETGQSLTVERVHAKLRLSLSQIDWDKLSVLGQLEQSKNDKNKN